MLRRSNPHRGVAEIRKFGASGSPRRTGLHLGKNLFLGREVSGFVQKWTFLAIFTG